MKDRTGGYAWKIIDDEGEELGGGWELDTTISRMELQAAISALREVNLWDLGNAEDTGEGRVALIISDSEHVVLGFNDKTRARNKNQDLWEELEYEAQPFDLVLFQHTKGHAGHPDNEDVDRLAGEFRQEAVRQLARTIP